MSIERQSMQDGPTQHLIGESVHRARAEFEAAIKRNPADATAMANLAHILIRTCEFEEAILLCQKAIGLKSHHYVAQNNLGVAYAGLGLLDKARDAFENAINASPGYAQPCLNLAQLYHQQEKWLEAEQRYLQYLELEPADVHAQYNLGVTYLKRGMLDHAASRFGTILRLDPAHIDAKINLGAIVLRRGNAAEAVRLLQQAVAHDASNELARYHLALAYVATRDLKAAATELEHIVAQDPRAVPAINNLALVYREMGDVNRAIELLEPLLGKEPSNATLHFNLCALHRSKGDLEAARRHLAAVLRIEAAGTPRYEAAMKLQNEIGGAMGPPEKNAQQDRDPGVQDDARAGGSQVA